MMSAIIPASGFLSYYTKSILSQDADSNIGKIWTCIADQIDEIEAQITLLKSIFDISSQTGENLDKIGNVLNAKRTAGETDANYLITLLIAIAENISNGTLPDIFDIIKIIKQGDQSLSCRIQETYPASFQLFTNIISLTTGTQVVLQQSRVAGVGIGITYSTSVYPFVFLGDSTGKGFSDVGETDGGDLSEVA